MAQGHAVWLGAELLPGAELVLDTDKITVFATDGRNLMRAGR